MISVKDILQGIKTEVLTVCDTVYTQERPTATDNKLKAFVVVSLPVAFHEEVIGMVLDWWVHTTVQFEVFVKDKATNANPNQMDIPKTDTLLQDICGLFPMKVEGESHTYNIVDPDVLYIGRFDENGFHKTLIQATLNNL